MAHIGVLKALEEENIEIEYIGGTSLGSIVSSLYAAGFSADEIYYIFKKYSKKIKYEIIYVDGIGDKIKKTVPEANSLIKQSQTITVYVEQKKSEKVKNMVNMTKDDAKIILEDYLNRYNIQYEIVTREVSDGINDVVLEQSIYDTNLDEISKIIITISKCEYYITMPNFVGENYKKAFEFCKENGFLFEGIYVNSILDTDTIIYQETDDGSNLRKNSNNKLLFYIAK